MNGLPYKAYAITENGVINLYTVAPTEERAKSNWLTLLGVPSIAFYGNIKVTNNLFERKADEIAVPVACIPVEVWKHERKPDRDVTAGMAAKVEELVDRIDRVEVRMAQAVDTVADVRNQMLEVEGAERRVKALQQGLNDVNDVVNGLSDRAMARNITFDSIHRRLASHDATLVEFERRISQIEDTAQKDRRGAHSDRETMWPRLGELAERITKLEAQTQEQQVQIDTIGEKGSVIGGAVNRARAATQVDTGSYAYPAARTHKCLGYINFYESGRGMTFHHTRLEADDRALTYPARRAACVEVFEGEGLS